MGAPVRTCVGCRQRADAADLLRLVIQDGSLVPDAGRRLPGRGAHLHRDLACLELAEKRRAFPRALRVPGPLDDAAVRELIREQVKQLVRGQLAGPSLAEELLADRRRRAAADDKSRRHGVDG